MTARPRVLYIDDERPNLSLFRRAFDEDFEVLTLLDPREALAEAPRFDPAVIVTDHSMPGMSGIEVLAQAVTLLPHASRVLLTAYSDRELLLRAIREGHVHDYVLKPWDRHDVLLRLRNAADAAARRVALAHAERERDRLREDAMTAPGMVVASPAMSAVLSVIERVARTDSTVMLRGESGTGKEILAHALHHRSARAGGPFVRTNCAALADGVLESELFGHEAGAFTGATKVRIGRFEQAHGGTLFLDEVGDISPQLQVRLLRVLQEREIERVGGSRVIKVDLRVVAATHRNLEELVTRGTFREDLYHRLNVVPIHVPPLRERLEDVGPLADHFLERLARDMGKRVHLAPEARAELSRYDWPGNVRELRNVIERAVALADPEDSLGPDDLRFDFWAPAGAPATAATAATAGTSAPAPSLFAEIADQEAADIRAALVSARGSKTGAARLLGIPRTTLNDKIRKHRIT